MTRSLSASSCPPSGSWSSSAAASRKSEVRGFPSAGGGGQRPPPHDSPASRHGAPREHEQSAWPRPATAGGAAVEGVFLPEEGPSTLLQSLLQMELPAELR
ncbi:hypothetical protein AB1Y20_014781 [Prymnesium parvum]|uniref:Uncharacterized protein n=1 Tax=Prymnesium parvum TaxID=97485 RepID=A0AB34IEM7_PRYPA